MKLAAVVGGVALACLACVSGHAADLSPVASPYKAAPGYIPAYFSWTGYYVGLEAGSGFGSVTFFDSFDGQTTPLSPSGFLLGGYTGVNYQVGSIVFGFEGNFDGIWAKTAVIDTLNDTETLNVFWTGTVTARLGWAFDRLLVFTKGGAAFLYQRDMISGPGPGGASSGSAIFSTWTLGGGAEWAITDHWIVRGEYDYMKIPGRGIPVGAPLVGTAGITGKFNEVKAGFAYKF
jgi:outer membrane immunogenic protein